jgi:hypothetical protein
MFLLENLVDKAMLDASRSSRALASRPAADNFFAPLSAALAKTTSHITN